MTRTSSSHGSDTGLGAQEPHCPAGSRCPAYGGDIAELLLAFALVSTWRPGRRTAARRRTVTVDP